MKTIRTILTGKSNRLIQLGIGLWAFFFATDLVVNVYFLHSGDILQQVFAPSPFEIWLRFHVAIVIVGFSTYAQVLTRRLQNHQGQLEQELIERKRAEDAIYKSEERYRDLVENIPDAIFTVDTQGALTYVSPVLERLSGYKTSEFLGSRFADFIHPDDLALVAGNYAKVLEGEFAPSEYRVRAKHGEYTWVRSSSKRVIVDGKLAGIQGVLTDISQRKQAEEETERLNRQIQLILEAAGEGIFGLNMEGDHTFVNPVAARILGYTADELIGRHSHTIWHYARPNGAPYPDEECPVYATLKDGIIHHGDEYFWRKDGRGIPVEFTSTPILESGNVVGAVVTFRDITKRKQAEDALKNKEKRFRALIENSLDNISLLDADGALLWESPAVIRNLGYAQNEFVGRNIFELMHPHDLAWTRALYAALIQEPGSRRRGSFRLRHSEGSWRWIEAVAGNLLDEPGIEAIVINYRDVTESKQAESALQESEYRYRTLVEQLPDTIYIDTFGESVVTFYISPQVKDLTGYGPQEWMDDPTLWEKLLHPDDRVRVVEENALYNITGERVACEYRLIARNGRIVWIRDDPVAIRDEAGHPLYTQGVLRDITEYKHAEERIRSQLRRLAALRAIDDTITGSFDAALALEEILKQAANELGIDAACVLLFNQQSQTLTYAAGRGFRTKALKHTNLELGEGYAGWAFQERRVLNIPDLRAQNTNAIPRSPSFSEEGFVTYYAVPLIAKGQARGVLEIFQRSPIHPDSEWLNFLETLAGQAAIAVDNAQLFDGLQLANIELSLAYDATIEGWSRALDLRDKETEGHTQRVTKLTLQLARALGISEAEIVHIHRGAILHDIGKMGVPDGILLKPGKLTDAEWRIMRQHPQFAYDMLHPISYLRPALDIPYCHHEKWDGTGYPRGLKGDEIPLAARIFAVADVWDALLSERPYRPGWIPKKIYNYIRSLAGTHFDPMAVELFLKVTSEKT